MGTVAARSTKHTREERSWFALHSTTTKPTRAPKSFALPQCMRAQEWRRNRRAEEKLDVVENAEIPAAAPPVARRDGQVKALNAMSGGGWVVWFSDELSVGLI